MLNYQCHINIQKVFYVPLLIYGKRVKAGINVGTRESFADVGATIAEAFKLEEEEYGKSFLKEILL